MTCELSNSVKDGRVCQNSGKIMEQRLMSKSVVETYIERVLLPILNASDSIVFIGLSESKLEINI